MTERFGYNLLRAALLLSAGLGPGLLPAATVVTIKVTVLESPPCVINDNKTIEVDFGNVMTNLVDGSNYEQTLVYGVTCTGNSSNAMKIQIAGSQAGSNFADNVLQTDTAGVGLP